MRFLGRRPQKKMITRKPRSSGSLTSSTSGITTMSLSQEWTLWSPGSPEASRGVDRALRPTRLHWANPRQAPGRILNLTTQANPQMWLNSNNFTRIKTRLGRSFGLTTAYALCSWILFSRWSIFTEMSSRAIALIN